MGSDDGERENLTTAQRCRLLGDTGIKTVVILLLVTLLLVVLLLLVVVLLLMMSPLLLVPQTRQTAVRTAKRTSPHAAAAAAHRVQRGKVGSRGRATHPSADATAKTAKTLLSRSRLVSVVLDVPADWSGGWMRERNDAVQRDVPRLVVLGEERSDGRASLSLPSCWSS